MSSYTAYLLQSVEVEIARLNGRPLQRLQFSQPLEDQFEERIGARRSQFHLQLGIVALVLFDLFLVGDWFIIPSQFVFAMFVRLGLVTPLIVLLLLAVANNRSVARREGAVAAMGLIAILSTLVLGFGKRGIFSTQVEPTVILVLILLTVVFRAEPLYSTIAVGLSLLATFAAIRFYYNLPLHDLISTSLTLAASSLLLLMANYMSARTMRISHLLQLQGELQSELLVTKNFELRKISERDELTGLSSRYRYEREVVTIFEKAVASQTPLSVVMVDVDHFKSVNDIHGHLYGDRVLERVGSLIQQALRAEKDFAARYGGEEFIVLLPDTDQKAALKVAERIRTLVQVAGAPALARDTTLPAHFTTVSCGVATCTPGETESPSTLVEAADRAMYRAKAEGRNRVCCIEVGIAA